MYIVINIQGTKNVICLPLQFKINTTSLPRDIRRPLQFDVNTPNPWKNEHHFIILYHKHCTIMCSRGNSTFNGFVVNADKLYIAAIFFQRFAAWHRGVHAYVYTEPETHVAFGGCQKGGSCILLLVRHTGVKQVLKYTRNNTFWKTLI